LFGIVANNAIILVDFINIERKKWKSTLDSLEEAIDLAPEKFEDWLYNNWDKDTLKESRIYGYVKAKTSKLHKKSCRIIIRQDFFNNYYYLSN